MRTIKQLLMMVALLLCSVTSNAYDFEVNGIYYNIISASDLMVEVTNGDNKYSRTVIIPSTVIYKSKTLSVTSIRERAFDGCSSLTSITIPNSVTSIGNDAFFYCTSLTSVTIPESVTSIGDYAFYNCYGLTNVTIGNSVTSIGDWVFYNCRGLTSVTIGNSVTSIGEGAFKGCTGLTSIYLLGVTPPTVLSGNFTESQYANLTLYVPKGSLETYQSADTWKIFWDIQEFDATGIEGVNANDIAIEVTANGITLSDADGKTVAIYSANGTRVANIDSYVGEEITLDRGVYIVRVGNNTLKVKL